MELLISISGESLHSLHVTGKLRPKAKFALAGSWMRQAAIMWDQMPGPDWAGAMPTQNCIVHFLGGGGGAGVCVAGPPPAFSSTSSSLIDSTCTASEPSFSAEEQMHVA